MTKTIIVLPDGTELSSGTRSQNAVMSSTITVVCNDSEDLSVGSACSAMVEAKLITPGGNLSIDAGGEITVYEDTDGVRKKLGLFTMEKPTRPSKNAYAIIAYDRVSWLDKDMTAWLQSLTGWPYTLFDFATMVCTECGLTLHNVWIPNGSFSVPKILVGGMTGRQLLKWCGQIAGRFIRATADGEIEFAWYTATDKIVTARDCQSGTIKYEDFTVAKIDKVQIRQEDNDVGVVYPPNLLDGNTYVVQGNLLLQAYEPETIQGIAESLYELLKDIEYTPAKWSTWRPCGYHAGDIVTLRDANGVEIPVYIFKAVSSGQKVSIESTGNRSRESSFAVNAQKYSQLLGRVMNISTSIDGIKVEAKESREIAEGAQDAAKKAASTAGQAKSNIDSLSTEVHAMASGLTARIVQDMTNSEAWQRLKTDISATADGVRFNLQGQYNGLSEDLTNFITEFNTRFSLLADGLHISQQSPDTGGEVLESIFAGGEIAFFVRGSKVAYISKDRLWISAAYVQRELSLGSETDNDRRVIQIVENNHYRMTWTS